MTRNIERTVQDLNIWLPYVADDSERYRTSSELVAKSHEFHLAAQALNETLPHPSLASTAKGPFVRVRIGSMALDALTFRKMPYDFLDPQRRLAPPGEVHDIRYSQQISTDVFAPHTHRMPVYGSYTYFDLATLGRNLRDGGELTISD